MTEMTPERRAAWQAEQDRKAEQRKAIDRERKNKSNRAKSNKAHAALANVEDSECLQQQAWLRAHLGPANYNASLAARMVGYPPASAAIKGWELKKKFAAKISEHFEDTYLQKSEVVAETVNTWHGPSSCFVYSAAGVFNYPATIDNMKNAGIEYLITQVITDKETHQIIGLKFRDPETARQHIMQMGGFNAPIKVTLTLDGKTPEEIADIAHNAKMRLAQAMIDAPREGDYIDADTSAADA